MFLKQSFTSPIFKKYGVGFLNQGLYHHVIHKLISNCKNFRSFKGVLHFQNNFESCRSEPENSKFSTSVSIKDF